QLASRPARLPAPEPDFMKRKQSQNALVQTQSPTQTPDKYQKTHFHLKGDEMLKLGGYYVDAPTSARINGTIELNSQAGGLSDGVVRGVRRGGGPDDKPSNVPQATQPGNPNTEREVARPVFLCSILLGDFRNTNVLAVTCLLQAPTGPYQRPVTLPPLQPVSCSTMWTHKDFVCPPSACPPPNLSPPNAQPRGARVTTGTLELKEKMEGGTGGQWARGENYDPGDRHFRASSSFRLF
ncbi:hypothetical protein KUCAC02_023724, partial [Chaenocephalus aceratus]